jgi:hypothetical protein
MVNIELRNRTDIGTPGLYLMRWQGRTGLVRIVGQPKTGYRIIVPEHGAETYLDGLPKDGSIPTDALISEPLAVTVG